MGFHKRRITYDIIRATYEKGGIKGLKTLFSADALFVPHDLDLGRLYEILDLGEETEIENWIKELPS